MSFRLKFLLTLLAFSLLPMLLVSFVTLRSLKNQGQSFAASTRQELSGIVESELEYTVKELSDSLKSGESGLWFALALLKTLTQGALQERAGNDTLSKVYTNRDYEDAATAPKDLQKLDALKPLVGKSSHDALFSLGNAAIALSPGTQRADVQKKSTLLAGLRLRQEQIFRNLGDDGFQQHICLEDGVYSLYPGHGGLPDDFDCRKQQWYLQTRASLRPQWTGPLADPVFGESVYVLAMPVMERDGGFAGVAALDFPLTMLLQEHRLAMRWSQKARSYLVAMKHNPQTGKPGLLIFAQRDYKNIAGEHRNTDYAWLESSDTAGMQRLMQDMRDKEAGVLELRLDGQEKLLAFARYGIERNAPVYLLVTLPKSVFQRLPDSFSDQALQMFRKQGMLTIAIVLAAVGLVTVVALLGAKSVTAPLLEISTAAKRLSQGEFDVHLDLNLRDERQQLVNVINNLGPQLSSYMEMRKSLEVAEEVQKSLLPHKAPEVTGFEISGTSLYCDETGGDYYDFLDDASESRKACAALIGDVTGHGIPSALLMATARALFRGIMSRQASLDERMTAVNRLLAQDLFGTGRFMTMFVVELEPDSPRVRWVSAGHDPALVYRPETDDFIELAGKGLPLGVMDDWVYEQFEAVCMEQGHILVMGTDGIWETMHEDSEDHSVMFGKQRLQDVIRKNAHLPASSLQQAVLDAVAAFRGNGRQTDDITLTVIKRS